MTFRFRAVVILWRLRISNALVPDNFLESFCGLSAPPAGRKGDYTLQSVESLRRQDSGHKGSEGWELLRVASLLLAMLAGVPAVRAFAQHADATLPTLASNTALPDAPGMGASSGASGVESPPQAIPASISGTVLDPNGDVIQGARVTLIGPVGGGKRIAVAGSNGEFTFSGLPPGDFRLTVSGTGMGTFVSAEIHLLPGDVRLVPQIVLPIAAAATSVRVFADREEMAEEQVHIAVEQRVLGVLPNFYSSYDWNAPPLGSKQKFELAFRSVTDPIAFLGAGALAGFEQGNNSFPGYGQDVQGYGKRYGAAYADDFIGRMMGSAVFPSLFHQDPRYFYKGSGTIPSRALYAIGAAFYCRGDNGQWRPNYSHVLGSFTAGGLSNLYYPSGSRGASLTFLNGLIETAGNAGNNLLREFLLRGLTSHVPNYANGKP